MLPPVGLPCGACGGWKKEHIGVHMKASGQLTPVPQLKTISYIIPSDRCDVNAIKAEYKGQVQIPGKKQLQFNFAYELK